MAKRASKKVVEVAEVEEVEQIAEPVAEVVLGDAVSADPKDKLCGVAVTLADILPTYSGPGRRHIEAALINVEHAIRYTP